MSRPSALAYDPGEHPDDRMTCPSCGADRPVGTSGVICNACHEQRPATNSERRHARHTYVSVSEGMCPRGHGNLDPGGVCAACLGHWTIDGVSVTWTRGLPAAG